MALSASQLVADLAAGQSLAEIASTAGISVGEAKQLWSDICESKVPPASAEVTGSVGSRVEILRDSYGVPHVYAQTERDLFYGLGLAMAQDRLWLMDYLRRKATGRLAELLGESYLHQDELYRILNFGTVCTRNYALLADRWRQVVDGMAAGINRVIEQSADNLPIEFDLLGYRPEPWSAIDILITLRYQWWGLSGRLQQITSATQLDRALGDKVAEFTKPERDDLYIVPDGLNAALETGNAAPVRDSLNVGGQPHGSNNWVIAGSRTRTGKPLLANDPHYTYSHAHGNFYPCHLNGAGHTEAGFVFLGTPGMMTGTNDHIAWGFTNNGATIRDLYAEELDDTSTHYRREGKWEPLAVREIEIPVKGKGTVKKTIRTTAHGPIVNDVIPKIGDNDPPLALRWVGFEMIDDVQALLEMNTATNWGEFRTALRNFACSVTNFIYGDREGNIGYQMSARVPLREVSTRGIRPAWDPAHEWQGYIPFDGNPRLENPPEGIVATANQRPVNPAYRWPIYGAYAGGTRQARILQVLRSKTDHDAADFRRMQFDSKSLIAEEVTPRVVAALQRSKGNGLGEIASILAAWDYTAPVEAVGTTIFEAFIHAWPASFAESTIPADQPAVRAAAGHAARRALVGEDTTLDANSLDALIVKTMRSALDELATLFGSDPKGWTWGKVHSYSWPHPLGQVGHLGELLNGPKLSCAGTSNVINNVSGSTSEPFVGSGGPTYRLIADLANPDTVFINSHCPTSGHPGSPHFATMIRDWAQGNYQALRRKRTLVEVEATGTTVIQPG